MIQPRANLGLAIDGGGVRGLLVAQGLVTLERELGGKPLIEHPSVKVLAGTSTGALITAAIALGFTANEIVHFYLDRAQYIFPVLFPAWLPQPIQSLLKNLIALLRPNLYTPDHFRTFLRDTIKSKTGNADFTLADLNKRLRSDQTLIITTVDVNERRTRFLKSYQADEGDWTLWEAVLASSSAPTAIKALARKGHFYTDGGVGSFGNPAYTVARELVEWNGCPASETSVFSFGTGWVDAANYQRSHGPADRWNALMWALNAPFVITDDALRAESLELINRFVQQGGGMDYRRFQMALQTDIDFEDSTTPTLQVLQALGKDLEKRIANDQHALSDPRFDPEGIGANVDRYQRSLTAAQSRSR